jgi:hypothetical protein
LTVLQTACIAKIADEKGIGEVTISTRELVLEMKSKTFVDVCFDTALHSELRRTSHSTNLLISQIVREATAFYIKVLNRRTEDTQHKQVTTEFQALAIDHIISSGYPDDRDRLIT